MISEAFPRIMAGAAARMRDLAVRVRYGVAPAPTGSSTMGIFRPAAFSAALNMAAIQSSLRVPILITRAPAIPVMSSTSGRAWAMTGEAPMASNALAVMFMTT